MSIEHPYRELIVENAARLNIDGRYIAAIILQESGGNPWAFRYEDGFYRRYVLGKKKTELLGYVPDEIPTLNSERIARAILSRITDHPMFVHLSGMVLTTSSIFNVT